ncbi:HI0074 family nucleotidyltransferase substrate-binding subunit [Aquabacterium sp.]|uniref:HI0074 family nucleotidyltransferase substrate-binding subunit n=1 Tax=Aquabacterium sp. TaxID=1872578 RepID=UPI0035B0DF6A
MPIDDRLLMAMNHFERALSRLNEVLAMPENDVVRDSIIQRFEFTFEAGWKAAYRWLRARGNDVDEEAYSVIPEAFKRRLIVDEAGWGQMRKYRNLTSHTYNQTLAIEVAAFVRATGAALLGSLLATLQERAGE